ncbi:MAG: STAS domain-containing protein [Candidatus Peregrinibacteria bacterium]
MPTFITLENHGTESLIAHLKGEVDVNQLPDLDAALKPALADPGLKTLILDCRELEFIDSKIVGFIAYLRTTLAKSQRQLCLAGLQETVNDILSLVGLTQIIPCFPTVEAVFNPIPA